MPALISLRDAWLLRAVISGLKFLAALRKGRKRRS